MRIQRGIIFPVILVCILTINCRRDNSSLQNQRGQAQKCEIKVDSPPKRVITGCDGGEMALVPTNVFFMGTNTGSPEERPRMRVFLESFYIDRFEISNEQFARFVKDSNYKSFNNFSYPAGMKQHPARGLSWEDAKAYCGWVGERLPTEYEWEKAARGVDGRAWPWGNEEKKLMSLPDAKIIYLPEYEDPAGQSPYGCLHMADNVWEWVDDWFDRYVVSALDDPRFGEKFKVLRGGLVTDRKVRRYSKTTDRMPLSPGERKEFTGTRCAIDVPDKK